MLAHDRGDYDAAEPLYRRSLEIMERMGDQAGMSQSYFQLGKLAHDRGDYAAAEPPTASPSKLTSTLVIRGTFP